MKLRTLLIALLIALAASTQALDPNGFEQFINTGHVYARSVVTTADGKPLWAEYNDQGGYSRLSSLAGKEGFVVGANQVRSYQALLQSFRDEYNNDIEIYSAQDFPPAGLQTADNREITGWKTLPEDAVTVVIPGKAKRHSDNGSQIDYYTFPVDMQALPFALADNLKTMLFDQQGTLLYSSEGRIGYLTAFYVQDGEDAPADAAEYENASSLINLSRDGYKVLDPIAGVVIEADTGYRSSYAVSGNDGFYRLQGFLSPCPGFSYFPEVTALATLYYSNFNPRGSARIPYYLQHTSYNTCSGYGAFPPDITMAGLMAQQNVIAITSSMPENITTLNYAVGINVLSGKVSLAGADIGEHTEYSAELSPQNFYMVADDYDGDGELDETKRGIINEDGKFEENADGNIYGVYFSANPRDDEQPNITRIMDIRADGSDKGLVSSISKEDLGKTDILVFRESTGELITQRVGLTEYEAGIVGGTGFDGDNNFAYTIAIRSPEDMHSFKSMAHDNFTAWQAAAKMSTALQSYKADFLRTGEQIRVVAINRPTGYIGTATTELTAAKDGGDLTVRVPPIVLAAPNLKIWATRRHQGQGLLANSDEERTTISNEGAATTDDTLIEIHTEWLDQDGSPLPAGLKGYGYTGRLTKQIDNADSENRYDNNVEEFDIEPGRQLQVLKFDNTPYHHYVQVNGYPSGEQNDFSAGDHTGTLRHRPSHYVPVKVPLYDEQGTIEDRIATEQAEQSVRDVTPRFNWALRPEFSFSLVDLEVSEVNLKGTDGEGNTQKINIINAENPVISSADDLVEVLFNLIGSEYDRITPLDGDHEYIFALGDQEIKVNINKGEGEQQQIEFENLEYLSQLNVEDYLTLSLYLNQDAQNILWDWAFTTLDVDIDSDNNNGFELPDRTLLEEASELSEKMPGKRIRINTGDVNQNKIPDFAEFEYVTKDGVRIEKKFVPFVVEIPDHIPIDGSTLEFQYSGSDPLALKIEDDPDHQGEKIYTAAEGFQRIWITNATVKRNPQGLKQNGDYIAPNDIYSLLQLGFRQRRRIKTFYIEAIKKADPNEASITLILEEKND